LTQVGYDEETKSFDIDRVTTGISSSKRGKIISVKEGIAQLESRLGKLIPIEELTQLLAGKLSSADLEESLDQLMKSGDIFRPKKGFIQKI
jgi:DNA replicative helicase MCM subunit Mcm2 (Cdc46/Mcm family)